MNRDFTLSIYKKFLEQLVQAGYSTQTFQNFIEDPDKNSIILRHDVDARKLHSLQFAHIQHEFSITGTYYFRMIRQSYDVELVREIEGMGHEIGYHYEDMDFANGDPKKAIELFEKNLNKLRTVANVKTVCMHGSPLSRYDNRSLWKHYDYRDFGIIAEPYFDVDFRKVFYLTDTGRRWDGNKVSVRDKVTGIKSKKATEGQICEEHAANGKNSYKGSSLISYDYKSTHDIINAMRNGTFPDRVIMNFHPQRWTDNPVLWTQELVTQRVKNVVKRVLIKWRA